MIEAVTGDYDYRVRVNGSPWTYQVNLLKKFYEREDKRDEALGEHRIGGPVLELVGSRQ